jgi:hypothetical protein
MIMSIMSSLTRDQLLQVQESARVFQARADAAFEPWGFRAPQPLIGQDPQDYRRELCIMAKRQLPYGHKLRIKNLKKLPRDVFEVYEPEIYDACREAASRPDSVAPGEIRQIVKHNPTTGHREVHYIGGESFVKDMGRPGRRVVSFMHRYNTSGVAFR